MKRIIILFAIILSLIGSYAYAEDVNDIIPSEDIWGMTKDELSRSLYEFEECRVGKSDGLVVRDYNVGFYNMDAYYVFGKDMGAYYGLSKIAYILSDLEDLSNADIKNYRRSLVDSLKEIMGTPDSEDNSVTTWKQKKLTVQVGTGKFKNYSGSSEFTLGIFFKGEPIIKKAVVPTNNYQATGLSSFYIDLNADRTITLKALETHDKECIIPSHYTVDRKKFTVAYVDDACFFGRTSLEILSLPEGVKTIAHNAFNSCGIKTLYFPKSLKDISGIFEYIHKPVTLYYAGTAKQWKSLKGAEKCPSNVKVICDTPVIQVTDKTSYSSSDLTTEKSNAEELGGAVANAMNGFLSGLLGDD